VCFVRPANDKLRSHDYHLCSDLSLLYCLIIEMEERTIGQYRVTGLIGEGGMGAVYAAEHTLLGRAAAIKVLLPHLSQDQDVVTRFFNEARAATAIRHPGIIEVYDFGWTPEGTAFIVMEHLQGETLSRRSERGRFGWQAALSVVRQIAGALAAAHAKGIVHRDLKPDNIFMVLDPEVPGGERIKLLDFGIAKLAGEPSSTVNVTEAGTVMGTPKYMAPEQCRGVAVDHRADLYALGCIMFELCSGRPPFVGEGTGDVLAAHIHVPPPSLASLSIDVPREVEELLQQQLAKSPSQRLANAETLIRAIDAITTEHAPSAGGITSRGLTTLSGAITVSRPLRRSEPHGRSRWIVVAAAAVLGAVVVVAVVERGSRDGATPGAAPPQPSAPSASPPAILQPPHPAPSTPHPDLTAATVDVAVASVPEGAQIMFAGAVLGKTPFHGTLPHQDGDVTLVIHLAGYADGRVVVHADRAVNERIKLVRSPPRRKANRDQSVNPFGK
jgi:serine/threonine protein kinase